MIARPSPVEDEPVRVQSDGDPVGRRGELALSRAADPARGEVRAHGEARTFSEAPRRRATREKTSGIRRPGVWARAAVHDLAPAGGRLAGRAPRRGSRGRWPRGSCPWGACPGGPCAETGVEPGRAADRRGRPAETAAGAGDADGLAAAGERGARGDAHQGRGDEHDGESGGERGRAASFSRSSPGVPHRAPDDAPSTW